ncbi:DUF4333 domain-containing protein [Mycolicibacterium arenosum]|uniref:DUF4333 domain-containing protein n=1 Tax=Mycolicibacterium arenosum TaxID=2952157 RepID=A0ABT1M5C7_9MYCO|nr:DUF4333 domain-containing protein [Mycolicibacterium sp. CAU 1645]MCP9274326.1 DUF4333 domain-containing protein [Mycolicibacterium sp. CAU 1645]
MAAFRSSPALVLAPVLASCSFSFSAGGPDYEKLENGIADELNSQYSAITQEVSGVECPRQQDRPKTGDVFLCEAGVENQKVRVEVTVEDGDNVSFQTIDTLFDLETTGRSLTRDVSAEYGFDVTVDCGEGLKVVPDGESFECSAADRRGDTRTVRLTAGGPDSEDEWEIVD